MCGGAIISDFIPASRSRRCTEEDFPGLKKPSSGGHYSKSLWSEAVEDDDDDFEADFQEFKDNSDEEEDNIKPSAFSAVKRRGKIPCPYPSFRSRVSSFCDKKEAYHCLISWKCVWFLLDFVVSIKKKFSVKIGSNQMFRDEEKKKWEWMKFLFILEMQTGFSIYFDGKLLLDYLFLFLSIWLVILSIASLKCGRWDLFVE